MASHDSEITLHKTTTKISQHDHAKHFHTVLNKYSADHIGAAIACMDII